MTTEPPPLHDERYKISDVVDTGELVGETRESLYVALSNHLGTMWTSQNPGALASDHLALGSRSISFDAITMRQLAGLLASDMAKRVALIPVHGEPVMLARIYIAGFARRCEALTQEIATRHRALDGWIGVDPLVAEFLAMPGNGTGGTLHTVLDDSDWSDLAIDRCISAAAHRTDVAAYSLARVIRTLSYEARLKLAEVCGCGCTPQPGVATEPEPSFTCPKCGAVSHNANDIEQRYCGRCHAFMMVDPPPEMRAEIEAKLAVIRAERAAYPIRFVTDADSSLRTWSDAERTEAIWRVGVELAPILKGSGIHPGQQVILIERIVDAVVKPVSAPQDTRKP